MVTKVWNVYGANGHRMKMSFEGSFKWDFAPDRIIEVRNSDITGTNDYVQVAITRETEDDCDREMSGQVSDGLFENMRVGKVVAVAKFGGGVAEKNKI